MVWFGGWVERVRAMRAPLLGSGGHTRVMRATMLLALIDGADVIGVPRDRWFHALPMSFKDLHRPGARVSWDELVEAYAALEQAGVSAADFARMGAVASTSPHLLMQRFVGFFARPEHVLFVGLRWMGPLLFPMLQYDFDYRGHEMTLRLVIPDELRPCASYFHMCSGTFPAMPELIGQPKARVSADITPREAVYRITVVRTSTGAGRLRRLAKAVTYAPRVLEALADQEREIRRSFEEVVRSQNDFRRVLGALPDPVIVYAGDRILYANPQLPLLLGYRDIADLGGLSWSNLVKDADELFQSPTCQEGGELRVRCKDDTNVILELSPAQEIRFEGEPARLVIARDVTARRTIENEMAIADRLSSLGMLSAGIAHEINNPLTLIITNLELASRVCNSRCSETAVRHVNAAIEGAERVREITRDLHIFAQPEDEVAGPVDVAKVVRSTLVLATGQARARATLHSELASTPPVMGSEGKLGQVLLNLVINAMQALPNRPAEDNHIHVRLRSEEGRVVVEVEDNGVGIPEGARSRLFEPFFSTKRATTGTGLGLAVAHGIVAGMGGTITFESQLGRGTVFTVSFPAVTEGARLHADVTPATDTAAPARGRVLVVDDEVALRNIVSQLLTAEDHEVTTAANGEQALTAFRAGERFDVIVCDLMMSNGSGVDVYRYLEANESDMIGRIIFMTGGVYRDDVREFLAGVDNVCLQKPFSLDDLCDAVTRIAAEARSSR